MVEVEEYSGIEVQVYGKKFLWFVFLFFIKMQMINHLNTYSRIIQRRRVLARCGVCVTMKKKVYDPEEEPKSRGCVAYKDTNHNIPFSLCDLFFSLSRSVFITISVWDLRLPLFVVARCTSRLPCFWLLMFVFEQRDSFSEWKGRCALYTVPSKYLSLTIVTVNGLYYNLFHCNKLFRIWNC